MRIGIFGGTFDPPHIAHLLIAEQAVQQLNLDVVYFVPAYIPPHKAHSGFASASQRWQMVRKAIAGNPKFRASDVELKRKGISYTIDTLHRFKERYPASALFLVLGGDNYRQFRLWKSPEEILDLATIVVYQRPGVRSQKSSLDRTTVFLQGAMLDLSSTLIRDQLRHGKSIKYLVSPAVEQYITARQIYKNRKRTGKEQK